MKIVTGSKNKTRVDAIRKTLRDYILFMEVSACAIFDRKQTHLRLSPAFEWPKNVLDGILHKGLDGSQAMKAAGLTFHEKQGELNGFVGLFTKDRMDRTDYNKTAVITAMMHIENAEHY